MGVAQTVDLATVRRCSAEAKGNTMKCRGTWMAPTLLALTAAGLLAVANCGGSSGDESAGGAPAKAAPAPAPAASHSQATAAAPQSSGASHEILSVLSVEHAVDVLAQRDGTVTSIDAEEGATVNTDAVLAHLDDRATAAQLEKAKADLRVAESNVKYNEAELKAMEARLRRAQEMFKGGLNSQADLEEAEFKAKGSAFDLESWHAAVDRSKADIRILQVELEKTHIRAPFHGVVAGRYVREGQNVLKDEKCFRLSQLGPLQIHFQVPETSGRRPVAGDRVRGDLANDAHKSFEARIRRVSPTVDAASGTYDVMAELDSSAERDLRPGMAVRLLWEESRGPKP
jgi:membrane fusion protein, multidrug efflux system